MSKPFAKSRIVYNHTHTKRIPGPISKNMRMAARLANEAEPQAEPQLGVLVSRRQRLVFKEETLEASESAIRHYYDFVACALQQPFTMGFCGESTKLPH